MHIRIQLVHKR